MTELGVRKGTMKNAESKTQKAESRMLDSFRRTFAAIGRTKTTLYIFAPSVYGGALCKHTKCSIDRVKRSALWVLLSAKLYGFVPW